jgi:large subunit ribosomal protein L15
MPLYRRLAHRGFSNYPFKEIYNIVNIELIEKHFTDGDTVDVKSLGEKGLVKGKRPVKILGKGDLSRKLTFNVDAMTVSAKEKVLKAGGTVNG